MLSIYRSATVVALFIALASPGVQAQDGPDPNALCASAQPVEGDTPPWLLTGSLEPDDETTRIDFLTFTAAPGTELVADLRGQSSGAGTLSDPFLGLFDSSCRLLDVNDDWYSIDSHLQFTVPDDGTFTLGITACCDYAFDGSSSRADGTWELAIEAPPPPIEAIEVSVIDSRTEQPLRGDQEPYASVTLYGCAGPGYDCDRYYAQLNANSNGRVRFDATNTDRDVALPSGYYRLEAYAQDYGSASSEPFEVAPAETFDIGVLALDPPALRLTLASDCGPLPPQGGLCSYSVRVQNNTSDPLQASVWSPVSANGLGSVYGDSRFLASAGQSYGGVPENTTHSIELQAGEQTDVQFSFYVPSFVAIGAYFCQGAVIGVPPFPLMDTLGDRFLFCVEKRDRGFRRADRTGADKLDAYSRKGGSSGW